MEQRSIPELESVADDIIHAGEGENTAARIGNFFKDILDHLSARASASDANAEAITDLQGIVALLKTRIYYMGVYQTSGAAETEAAQPAIAGNENIVFAIYKIYGGGAVNGQGVIENYPYGAFCTQILHLNTRTFARVINFSDANRGTVTAVGAWSQVKVASVAEWNSAQQRITAVEGSLGSPGDGDDPLKNTAWAWIEELGWRTDGHDQTLAEYEARLQALEQRAGINNQ